jgi:hypothetical protein
MIDCRTTLPFDFPLSWMEEASAFSKMTQELARLMPT